MARGRPINQESKLGRLLVERRLHAYDVSTGCGFSPRMMTEYLANRRIIREHHLQALCKYFNLPAEAIVEDLEEDLTDASGAVIPGKQHIIDARRQAALESVPPERRVLPPLPSLPQRLPVPQPRRLNA